jgi:hypothetical protein
MRRSSTCCSDSCSHSEGSRTRGSCSHPRLKSTDPSGARESHGYDAFQSVWEHLDDLGVTTARKELRKASRPDPNRRTVGLDQSKLVLPRQHTGHERETGRHLVFTEDSHPIALVAAGLRRQVGVTRRSTGASWRSSSNAATPYANMATHKEMMNQIRARSIPRVLLVIGDVRVPDLIRGDVVGQPQGERDDGDRRIHESDGREDRAAGDVARAGEEPPRGNHSRRARLGSPTRAARWSRSCLWQCTSPVGHSTGGESFSDQNASKVAEPVRFVSLEFAFPLQSFSRSEAGDPRGGI